MAQNAALTREMSIKMNKALRAIGVNDEMIQTRRDSYLQIESNDTAIRVSNPPFFETPYYFGSQSEGTTTVGLASDTDYVFCANIIRVVHNDAEQHGDLQMVLRSKPGYCFLLDKFQQFKAHHKNGTSYVKNSFQIYTDWFGETPQMEGPAIIHQTLDGDYINCVWAFPCISWPSEVRDNFLSKQRRLSWPSGDLVEQILQSECFVVPKGSDIGENSDIEWRLSFSCGERLLMFDLHVIQIRCYILMKYIKTTFLDSIDDCKGVVSSYVCKTVLFHVISQTRNSVWFEEELLTKLTHCLVLLRKFINERNCPHFILPTNNLFAGKLDSHNRCLLLSNELDRIIKSNGLALFDIEIDEFGKLLQSGREYIIDNNVSIQGMMIYTVIHHLTASWLKAHYEWHYFQIQIPPEYFGAQELFKCKIEWLLGHYRCIENKYQWTRRMIDSVKIAMCKLSSILGSILTSNDFEGHRSLSHEAFQWLLLGLQCSDAASSYLKLASILFFDGDLECANTVLDDVSTKLSREQIDSCCLCQRQAVRSPTFNCLYAFLNKKTFAQIMRENIGFCVTFLPCEIIFCPKELQFEMFRTTFCDWNSLPKEHSTFNNWLRYAVIPPEPFLQFMQYKLYKQRRLTEKSNEALRKLIDLSMDRRLANIHRETTLNLVAQCLEQEGDAISALYAYTRSLTLQPNYNAARILLCCNLYKQFTLKK